MDHRDHVELLRPANLTIDATWADLWAGSGALLLVDYNVDRGNRWAPHPLDSMSDLAYTW